MCVILDHIMITRTMDQVRHIAELRAALEACLKDSDRAGAQMVSIYIAHALESLSEIERKGERVTETAS